MAPTFIKELRRRSRASFRTSHSTDTSSDGVVSHGTTPSTGSVTPPSIAHQSDPALNLQLNKDAIASQQSTPQHSPRPPFPPGTNSSRNSVSGMSGLGSPATPGSSRTALPISPYAPRILNVSDNAWVYQKALLLYGTIGENIQHSLDGTVTISRSDDNFPPTSWPVCGSHFKALVYLQPGPNKLRFDFSSPALANSASSNPIHASYMAIHMIPALDAPPLQLAIILGKDSPGTFDSVPTRAAREGNGLDTAVRKYRMAAYLWQAFTAEQMWRHKLGRRSFRFEEEWTSGTSNHRDRENGTMRSEARIHVIRSEKTVAEIQRASKGDGSNSLFDIAAEAIRFHLNPLSGQRNYVSALMLDTHWDTHTKTTMGHVAAAGRHGDLQLAVFGSQYLYSYPTAVEEVVPAFTDCTPADSRFVSNEDDAGSSWEAANIGIGAHLHEIGRLLGCPAQDSGVMLKDYVVFNRTFVVREAYSTRTKSKGGLALQGDECGWHRLDCLRFRGHPTFRLPGDSPLNPDHSVQVFVVDGGNVTAVAATGISFVEIYTEDDDVCHAWIEYATDNSPVQRQVTISEQDLRNRLPEAKRKSRVKVTIFSLADGSVTIDDFKKFTSKQLTVKIGNGKAAFRSNILANPMFDPSRAQDLVLTSAVKQNRVLSRLLIYHGSVIDGFEFVYDDDSTQLFGVKGDRESMDVFEFDRRRGEYISGFIVRADTAIDSLQVLTSLGRRSPAYGNPYGGSCHTMIPPRGYSICGVSGSQGPKLDGLAVLITR
jgi:hypothetical protein